MLTQNEQALLNQAKIHRLNARALENQLRAIGNEYAEEQAAAEAMNNRANLLITQRLELTLVCEKTPSIASKREHIKRPKKGSLSTEALGKLAHLLIPKEGETKS